MRKPKPIEATKNILLVVLFLSTMLLLYFFWGNPMRSPFHLSEIIGESDVIEIPDVKQITVPLDTVVNFSGGVCTKIGYNDNYAWDRGLSALSQFSQDEKLSVEEITEDQYSLIMEFRSIRWEFRYSIPYMSFCNEYQIKYIPDFDQIGYISSVGYSVGSPESLFLYDNINEKYYRIVSENVKLTLDALISEVESNANDYYYSIGAIVGNDNRTIIPLSLMADLDEIVYEQEFKSRDEEWIRSFSQTFFGESFDFIRRIEESKGTIIYMYGYGDKVLTINANGIVEYKEIDTSNGTLPDYFSALKKAMQFIAYHGGWGYTEQPDLMPYVKNAEVIEKERKKGYRFVIGFNYKGNRIYYQNYDPIVIEIFGDQITYYNRNVIRFEGHKDGSSATKEAYSAVNMIAQNYQYIYSELVNNGFEFEIKDEEEELFDKISDMILFVEAGYVKPVYQDGESNVLIPAWIVSVGDYEFYFDLYEARPLIL